MNRRSWIIVCPNDASRRLRLEFFKGPSASEPVTRTGRQLSASRSETATLRIVRLVVFVVIVLRLVGEADGGGEDRVDAGALHPLRQRQPPLRIGPA